jgi:putative NADPH-quinone reductase
MKKIIIIVGHPLSDSLSGSLARSYQEGAKNSGAQVKIIYLGDLKFDPILRNAYKKRQDWEPDLKKTVDDLLWADHLVFITPIWWGSMTALLKGFFDRTFLSHFMFEYKKGSPIPVRLMKGKSARILITMDDKLSYYQYFIGHPIELIFRKAILNFCGVKPVRFSYFSQVRKATPEKIQFWLNQVKTLGQKMI